MAVRPARPPADTGTPSSATAPRPPTVEASVVVALTTGGCSPTTRRAPLRRNWLGLEPDELDPRRRLDGGPARAYDPTIRGRVVYPASSRGRRVPAPLKAALLDQRTLAGLGNIYVDEALWYARLHPLRPAGSLDRNELRRLHRAIRRSLELGIARQGSTLTDYRLPDGSSGSMQDEFRVYGRTDEPCDRCGTVLAKTRVAGRGTWFCPSCQPSRACVRSARPANGRGRYVAPSP